MAKRSPSKPKSPRGIARAKRRARIKRVETARRKVATVEEREGVKAPEQPQTGVVKLDGESYTIENPGEVRRRHQGQVHSDRSIDTSVNVMDRCKAIDTVLSRITRDLSCQDLAIIGMHLLAWSAEIHAAHEDEEDVPDAHIHAARLFFPSQHLYKLLSEFQAFTDRARVTEESAVDYLVMRMRGDTKATLALN